MSPERDDVVALSPDQTPAGWSGHADAYDTWAAPLTSRYAEDVVRELQLGPGTRFLDVAAGTGALTLAAARRGAEVHAIDFAPGMIDALRRRLTEEELTADTQVMDGQALAFPDRTFDAAASMLGLVFFPDMAAGARELRRVLRFGGCGAVVSWAAGGFTVQRLVLESLALVLPGEPPPSALPAAFRLSDPAVLEMLLHDAGFASVEVRELRRGWPVPDPEALFRSVPSWSAPMRPVFEGLDPDRVAEAAVVFADLVRRASDDDGLPTGVLLAIGSR